MTRLIGMGGLLASGKDAFADRLVAAHGYVKLGMSDVISDTLAKVDPVVGLLLAGGTGREQVTYTQLVQMVGYVEAKRSPEVRGLLQRIGTEVGRAMFGDDVWVDLMARRIEEHLLGGTPVVVTGIRFPNELRMVDSFAGRALWVHRSSSPATVPRQVVQPGAAIQLTTLAGNPIWLVCVERPAPPVHASETSVTATDFHDIVENAGTLADLHALADEHARGKATQYA